MIDEDDKVWKRLPAGRPLAKSGMPAGKPPAGPRPYGEAYYRIRRIYEPPTERAYIVWQPDPSLGADGIAVLIREDGRILYSQLCSSAHNAFAEIWARRPTHQHDHPRLAVDPHAYSLDQFKERQPAVYDAMNGLIQRVSKGQEK